jgi:hypothetical protein
MPLASAFRLLSPVPEYFSTVPDWVPLSWYRYRTALGNGILIHSGTGCHTVRQCGGSGMFIPDPDFFLSRITDLGSRIQKQEQKRGVKKKILSYLFM